MALGGLLVVFGLAVVTCARWVRGVGLRYSSTQSWVDKWPFGGRWMRSHKKEHLLSIRLSGLAAVVLGAFLLYLGLMRL